ncbi:adenosylcobinamide-GDP ribazoletransferase [Cyanobium sp. Morenito 9A2]|uniref:adenosylcobinamide-GDP ribazoletransferase n=1 Tax=Cyanobium sp. Morenito 9A2 TaxID=2823718 RepID=UPI0020CBF6C0|nr:adenosylcobinamide-GDP ribazoletransferase [Cyanobium sp. Morenito 9A2]MCP9849620.1 adenosylcobinamide-GDP ribazoletransferase [Cyanobium sp. Morenito 9A2]
MPLQRPKAAPGWLGDLAGAWIFYSVLPLGAWPRPRFERIARFAPWVGLVIGSLQALLWWASVGRIPVAAQVALVVALGLWLSGGLHMDGAMDTADGLGAGPRCLEAMEDSRVGAAGVLALVQLLLLRAAALFSLAALVPALVPFALIAASVWGRMAPLVAMERFPYLRPEPEGSAGFHRRHWRGLGRELRPSLVLLGFWAGLGAVGAWPGVLWSGGLPALLVPLGLGRRLGGHSGDSYGACVEWSEALALAVMALLVVLGWA